MTDKLASCKDCGGFHTSGPRYCHTCGRVHVISYRDAPRRARYLAMDYECPGPLLLREYPIKMISPGVGSIAPLAPGGIELDERFQGALYAWAVSHLSGYHIHVAFGPEEHRAKDEDCVHRWPEGDDYEFAPVQLKTLVSALTNPDTSLEDEMRRKLPLYGSPDLQIVWTINREMHLDPRTLDLPPTKAAGVWVVSAGTPDLSEWHLCGDFVNTRVLLPFPYPAPRNP